MNEDYIKYLATLCEGRNLLREYEQYYDPETGYTYDDEGNRFKGPPNPKYDVSDYWPYTGRNAYYGKGPRRDTWSQKKNPSSSFKSTPKVIDKDKLYFGREAKSESALVYFLYQANGLYGDTMKLPPGVEKPDGKSYGKDICALASVLCGKEFTKFNGYATNIAANLMRSYFAQEKRHRDASELKTYLEKNLK